MLMMHRIFGDNLFDNENWFETPLDKEMLSLERPLYGKHAKHLMKTDVQETDDSFQVDIDLPGFQKEDIQVHLEDGYLQVAANKSVEKEEKNEKGVYLRQERYTGSMARSFYVGETLTPEDIQAKYENGILTLTLPKKQPEQISHKGNIAIEG